MTTITGQFAGPVTITGLDVSEEPDPPALASTVSGQLDLAGGWRDAWEHERRGRHGEWSRTGGAAPVNAFLRGTPNEYKPGDLIIPHPDADHPGTGDVTRFTNLPLYARRMAQYAAGSSGKTAHVYVVEPTGPSETDPGSPVMVPGHMSWRTRQPLRVVGEYHDDEEAQPRTAGEALAGPDYSHVRAQLAIIRAHPDAWPVFTQLTDDAADALNRGDTDIAKKHLRVLANLMDTHPAAGGGSNPVTPADLRDLAKQITRQAAKGRAAAPAKPGPVLSDSDRAIVDQAIGALMARASGLDYGGEYLHLRTAKAALAKKKYADTIRELRFAVEASHLNAAGGPGRADAYKALIRQIDPSIVTTEPEITSTRGFLEKNAGMVPGMFGKGLGLAWDGRDPDEYPQRSNPSVLAGIDWRGHMSVSDLVAKHLRAGLAGDGPVQDADAPTVILHEMIHAVMPPADFKPDEYRGADARAYQDPAGQAIEEGFTQLGTDQHAREFFEHAGIAGRPTEYLGDIDKTSQQWKDARDAGTAALATAADHLLSLKPSDARSDAQDAVSRAIALLSGHDNAYAIDDAVTALNKLVKEATQRGTADGAATMRTLMDDTARIREKQSALLDTTSGVHLTMGEYADAMADPAMIRAGGSWPHYIEWTAAAQNFGDTIAELGGKPGDPGEIRRVSDAVNSVGPARKMRVMAELTMTASGADRMDPPLSVAEREQALASSEEMIRQKWRADTDVNALVKDAAKAFRSTVAHMRMSETGAAA